MDDENEGLQDTAVDERDDKDEKSISADLIRGHINTIILRALYDGDKYGYEIIAEIERKSHGQYSLKQPSLYSALKRLEKDGYVTSYWGGSVAGGRRKYFSLTDEGRTVSEQNQSEWEYSRTVIDSLISDKDFDFNNPAPSLVNMRVLRSSTSRVPRGEGEDDELDYEPIYDDSIDTQRIQSEFEEKRAALEADETALDEKRSAIETDRAALDADKADYDEKRAALDADKADYDEKRAALDADKADYDEKRAALDADMADYDEKRAALDADMADYDEKRAALDADKADYDEKRAALDADKADYDEKRAALDADTTALDEQRTAIETDRAALDADKAALDEAVAAFEADKTSYGETALAEEKAALDAERERFEEEMKARKQAAITERDWRERELETRERLLAEEKKHLEELLAEKQRGAAAEAALLEANRAAEDAERSERIHALEQEETTRKAALDEEEARRKAALDEEESKRKAALDEEEAARKAALDAEEETRRNALAAEEAERRRILDEEEARRKAALDAEEEKRHSDAEAADALRLATETRREEELKIREQEMAERETFYTEERKRFADLLRQRDELIESERRAHAADLAAQEQRIIAEQELLFRRREKELIHRNYMDLVSAPPRPATAADEYSYYSPAPAPAPEPAPAPAPEQDYRTVVQRIYAGTAEDAGAPRTARPVDGMDFSDLESRAQYDGIKITTTGSKLGKAAVAEEPEAVVHKGRSLFLSAIVVLFLCIVEGAVLYAVRDRYGISILHPCFIWGGGLILLLVTGLMYANHYGRRAIRRTAPIMVNALVLYALCVIITLIVALSVKIDFTSITDLANYIVVPVVAAFSIVIFGLCYYLLTRPYDRKK